MNTSPFLPCQKHLFDIPDHVCFLNAAAWSPLPLSAVECGKQAVERKARPWAMQDDLQQEQCEAARSAAATLVGAQADDIAIIPSVGYGVALAAKALSLPTGSRVIVLQDDHTSPVLEWTARPEESALSVTTVSPGPDGDWTTALVDAIDSEAVNGLSLVSISNVHWSDGGLIDMERVRAAVSNAGAALLVDATHAVGVLDMDVGRLDPDFLIFPTYKWLLGPYGRAFIYIAKRWQQAVPLEQTMSGRKRVRAEDEVYFSDLDYVGNARRFDMGERDFFISLDMARHGMELVQSFGRETLEARLAMLTSRIAKGLEEADLPVTMLPGQLRASHILSIGFTKGMPKELGAALRAKDVYVAPRLGRLRIAPHAYNDEDDCDRFVERLGSVLDELSAR